MAFLRSWRYLVALSVLAAVAAMVAAAPAQSATFTVTNPNDSGPGSLRQAILDANTTPGADTITFSVTGTITLTSGQLTVTDPLTIDGPGAGSLTISGLGAFVNLLHPLLDVDAGTTLNIDGVTFADATNGIGPAGIRNFGTLNVSNAVFADNLGTGGGGIGNEGTGQLSVSGSTFSSNSPGIANRFGAIAVVSDSTFTGNERAIQNDESTLTVTGSTFSENSSGEGAGIRNASGSLSVTNSTFSGNTAGLGGGVENIGFSTAVIANSTFSGNSASEGAGVFNFLGSVELRNTIVSNSTAGGNCSGIFTDGGGNLSWPDATCPGINQDPVLGSLANNGGPTETMALSPGSPAIDAAVNCPPPATDQRGVIRPQGKKLCDIGAFEYDKKIDKPKKP